MFYIALYRNKYPMNQLLNFYNRIISQWNFKLTYPILLSFFTLTLIISNCSISNTDSLLSEEQFVDILAELMITEQLKISHAEKLSLIKHIFKNHNITSEEFYTYKIDYENDPQRWISIYKKVEKRIKQLSGPDRIINLGNNSKRDTNATKN